eukprot:TRINITY_DN697_c0_g1_i2.p1 TRINITY_DN697_c0_g1~~TRINITY_DN697_c0_g1_i2.p1  ORF type:complete len:124 (-),score=9.61 TRINITY_DN697_c0_g1_i2:35-406(-)
MIRRPPRSTLSSSSAASDVYKRQFQDCVVGMEAGAKASVTLDKSFKYFIFTYHGDGRDTEMYPDANLKYPPWGRSRHRDVSRCQLKVPILLRDQGTNHQLRRNTPCPCCCDVRNRGNYKSSSY